MLTVSNVGHIPAQKKAPEEGRLLRVFSTYSLLLLSYSSCLCAQKSGFSNKFESLQFAERSIQREFHRDMLLKNVVNFKSAAKIQQFFELCKFFA